MSTQTRLVIVLINCFLALGQVVTVYIDPALSRFNPFIVLLTLCGCFQIMAGIAYRSLAKKGSTSGEIYDYKLSQILCFSFGFLALIIGLDFRYDVYSGPIGAITELLVMAAAMLYMLAESVKIAMWKYHLDHRLSES